MEEKKEDKSAPRRETRLFRNWFGLLGILISAGSVFSVLFLFAISIFVPHSNPYTGILVFLVAPFFFFLGVALILFGLWWQRRQKPGTLSVAVDLTRPKDRKLLGVFIGGAVVFLLCSAIGSYRTYNYTDSVQFCGTACHVPMKPEYTAYLQSPHARVACVECHVGPGIKWYIKSKINGVHQVYDVTFGKIPRPIETPLVNLRPARETCEQCHWPQRFIGYMDRTDYHYLADKTNTPFAVRLLLKVGGQGPKGNMTGIHWHVSRNFQVQFIATDRQEQHIPWVRVTDRRTGKVTVFKTPGFHGNPAHYTIRTMDCVTCHTRPAHDFLSPDEAVDDAIHAGLLNRSVPWVKSNAVAVLVRSYKTTPGALKKIAATLHADYPKLATVNQVIAETQRIYQRNFFPEMKTDWRTHPDNIGHKIWPGCFRCHDGNHVAANSKQVISANCNLCHIILAQGRGAQLDKLNAHGYNFYHIDSTYLEPSCAMCHTGGGGSMQL